jgi:hypothetical protein
MNYHTPETKCLACGHILNGVFPVPGEKDLPPEEGCRTLCIRCGALMVFNKDLTLREPTEEEKAEIDSDPIVKRARDRLQQIRARLN